MEVVVLVCNICGMARYVWLQPLFRIEIAFIVNQVLPGVLVYAMVIPVVPFQLEKLGYKHPASLTGWLLFAYG